MVVTGRIPGGFFVTDMTACRVREYTGAGSNVRTPEPDGFLPGHYGSIYIYNYSFPEGLYPGDLLWTISGSVQDFAATTQLTFPSWVIREHVRELPPAEWEKYLKLVPVVELNGRYCGLDNVVNALRHRLAVRLQLRQHEDGEPGVRAGEAAPREDSPRSSRTATPTATARCPSSARARAAARSPRLRRGSLRATRTCPSASATSTAPWAWASSPGRSAPSAPTYTGFGQFVVEMPGPGPREAGLDDSLERRTQVINVSLVESRSTTTPLTTGVNGPSQVRVWCDTPVRVKFGPTNVRATIDDAPLAAKVLLEHTMTGTEQHVAVLADGDVSGRGQCHVSINSRIRINVVTRDAVPDLEVDCQRERRERGQGPAVPAAARGHLQHHRPPASGERRPAAVDRVPAGSGRRVLLPGTRGRSAPSRSSRARLSSLLP